MNLNFEDLKITVNQRYDRMQIDIWVFVNELDGTVFFNYENGKIKETKIPITEAAGDDLKPFMCLHPAFSHLLFKAISDYNAEKGIKSKDQSLIEGKLIATEKHLQDMSNISKQLLNFVTENCNEQRP